MVETQYCITVGNIPEAFYIEIGANEAQREEWVKLYGIDEIEGNLTTPSCGNAITPRAVRRSIGYGAR